MASEGDRGGSYLGCKARAHAQHEPRCVAILAACDPETGDERFVCHKKEYEYEDAGMIGEEGSAEVDYESITQEDW